MKPEGEVMPRADTMGSLWALSGGLRSAALTGCPVTNRNRPVRTRTQGGVGPVAGSPSQSRGPNSAFVLFEWCEYPFKSFFVLGSNSSTSFHPNSGFSGL